MATITFEIPDTAVAALRVAPEELAPAFRLAAAIRWYQQSRISQEQAAVVSGLNRADFLDALAREKVDVFQVDMEDLSEELRRG